MILQYGRNGCQRRINPEGIESYGNTLWYIICLKDVTHKFGLDFGDYLHLLSIVVE